MERRKGKGIREKDRKREKRKEGKRELERRIGIEEKERKV